MSTKKISLNWSSKSKNGTFEYKSRKKAIGNISINGNEAILEITNSDLSEKYARQYIKNDIKNYLDQNITKIQVTFLNRIQINGEYYFKNIGGADGTSIDIPIGSAYYGKFPGIINCDNMVTENDYSGTIVKSITERCVGGIGQLPQRFTIVKILK
jgi:hypothetical protein